MRFACGLLLLGLLSLSPVFAQFSGRVTGSVVDASGASVPEAQVDLYISGGKKPILSTKTSSDGQYNFNSVRPGALPCQASRARGRKARQSIPGSTCQPAG